MFYLVVGQVGSLLVPVRRPVSPLENKAEKFAHELARRTRSSIREYPQFLTYKIEVDGLPPIDVTTTRKETYPHPGALPVVTPSDLRDDLQRRDFAMNAIALELTSEAIHDPTEATARWGKCVRFSTNGASIRSHEHYSALRLRPYWVRVHANTEALCGKAIEGDFAKPFAGTLWREFLLAVADRTRPCARVLASGSLARFRLRGSEPTCCVARDDASMSSPAMRESHF